MVILGLALSAATLSVVPPVLLIFVPLGITLLALAPGRPFLQVAGVVLLATLFLGTPDGRVWYAERGWALTLGAWFVLASALRPRWRFLSRSLASVGASAATVAAIFAARGGWRPLDDAIGRRFRESAAQVEALWRQAGLGNWAQELASAASRAAEMQAVLYPALLALASVAALGVAWWGYGRLVGAEGEPLGALRDFRFRDELVWLAIAGLLLALLPLGAAAGRIGENLLVVMAALYAVRGSGVLLSMVRKPSPLGAVVAALLLLLLYPFVMGAALVVGLSDTWLDFRTRRGEAGGAS